MYGFVTAVVRPQGVTAVKGGSDQQLGRQQKIAVLAGSRVRSAFQVRTDDGGPGLKRPAGLSQQFPGAQHPGVRGHKAAKSVPGEWSFPVPTPPEAGRPTLPRRT